MYEQETDGLVVRVEPAYLARESDPEAPRFVWSYAIEIENRTPRPVQLLSRYWRITDESGLTQEVRGAGVVGEQPVIEPGETYSYQSACPLTTASGVMVGAYTMRDADSDLRFDIAVPAFALECPHARRLAN
ncbi:MAG: Co2+/Mg2+ efflux protein ApaG [Hyphomonadaceae bacterium]